MQTDDGDVIIIRRRRWGWWVVTALAVAGLVVGGALFWWRSQSVARSAQEYAASVATALAAGRLPDHVDVPDRVAAQDEMTRVLSGMEGLRHSVDAADVTLGGTDREGTVTLAQRWIPGPGSAGWEYTTTMHIERADGRWRGRWEPSVLAPDLAAGQGLRAVRTQARRGDVLGPEGDALVMNRAVVRVGIDKTKVDAATAAASAKALAEAVGIDPGPYVAAVTNAGPKAFVEAIVLREDSPERAALAASLSRIPGSLLLQDRLPLAPTSTFARPILGTVGAATAEIIEKSGGTIRAGDLVGLSGLQAARDEQLRGTPGLDVRVVDLTSGATVRAPFRIPARDGGPVRISLSEPVQRAAEESLAKLTPASAIVAIRPSDGHVLAAASGPGSDGRSTATLGRYAPGSTFKVVSSLALLRAGLTPTPPMDCPATITVDGRVFKNHDGYPASQLGRINLRRALAHSCNTAFIGERQVLKPDDLGEAAQALGLTADPALGVPATLGDVPPDGSAVEDAASMIGQGKVLASPLGMATVAASIQAGEAVRPVLVLDPAASGSATPGAGSATPGDASATPGAGSATPGDASATPGEGSATPEQSAATAVPPRSPLTGMEAAVLRDLMRAVVTEGTAGFLADAPGGEVFAKTGTAEYGTDTPPRTHAWIIAIRGDLAVAVFVEDGAGGATTAGPVLSDFLRRVPR